MAEPNQKLHLSVESNGYDSDGNQTGTEVSGDHGKLFVLTCLSTKQTNSITNTN